MADNVKVVDAGVVAQIEFESTPKVLVSNPIVCVGIGTTVKVITFGNVKQPKADCPTTVYEFGLSVGEAATVAPVLLLNVAAGAQV